MPNILYPLYDLSHVALTPIRLGAEMTRDLFQSPGNPASFTPVGRITAAASDLAFRLTRRFEQPAFGIRNTEINGKTYHVRERDIQDRPFCKLKHFVVKGAPKRPKMLVAAPQSGHFATLLRGTVEALLPYHDVYITDWKNARNVPLSKGYFDLDDCVEYYMNFLQHLGPDVDVFAVCQPSVPVLIAVTMLNKKNKKIAPRSMILMGGPVDTRVNPTEVNKLAEEKSIEWFEQQAVAIVPPWYAGAMRRVYPGFLQLTGFLSMNLDRHIDSYFQYFLHLVQGDGESAKKHRDFYNEYLAVQDIPAEFYIQTVERIFQKQLLAKREYIWRGEHADPAAITHTALLCIEGELDDISATGQTKAAMKLCSGLKESQKKYHLQAKAGHYGLFSGSRWRSEVRPLITDFVKHHTKKK
jgi:poly(3-hydroxybutyrate) depolymerase